MDVGMHSGSMNLNRMDFENDEDNYMVSHIVPMVAQAC